MKIPVCKQIKTGDSLEPASRSLALTFGEQERTKHPWLNKLGWYTCILWVAHYLQSVSRLPETRTKALTEALGFSVFRGVKVSTGSDIP